MVNLKKVNVWIAAMNAVRDSNYGTRVLIANDVAKALDLQAFICDKGFELVRLHNKNNPCSKFTRIAFVKA